MGPNLGGGVDGGAPRAGGAAGSGARRHARVQGIPEPPLEARAAAEAAVAGLPALAPPVVVQVQPRPAAPGPERGSRNWPQLITVSNTSGNGRSKTTSSVRREPASKS